MKLKQLLIIALMCLVVTGCRSPSDPTPSGPDRGTIPGVEQPIIPPGLTNEWSGARATNVNINIYTNAQTNCTIRL